MSSTIYVEEYSNKSFVVRGDTREHKESLKVMGGKWNSRLTDKESGEKFGAWLFWSDKRVEIDDWLNKDCPEMESTRNDGSSGNIPTYGSSGGIERQIALTVKLLDVKVDRLNKMLEAICELHDIEVPDVEENKVTPIKVDVPRRLMRNTNVTRVKEEEEIDIDDDEPKVPHKRLIGKKTNHK